MSSTQKITITPQMLQNGYNQLPKFRNAIKRAIKKFVDEVYFYDDGFGMADMIMEKILDKFPDDTSMLSHDKILATYEYLFGYFKSPQELIAIHDQELSISGRHFCDAYIRLMIKGKKIWVENWVYNDDYADNGMNGSGKTDYYGYNMSAGITAEQRDKLYGENIVNLYEVATQRYFYDEDISW